MKARKTTPLACEVSKPSASSGREAPCGVKNLDLCSAENANGGRQVEMHEMLMLPSAQNGRVMQAWGRVGEVDLTEVANSLREASKDVIAGNTNVVEALLFDQAMALQAIFTNLSIEAASSGHLSKMEPMLRLALKAQSQSRATLETLAMIKSPPVVYARQANIANGPQQVNNGPAPTAPYVSAPACSTPAAPTELLPRSGRHGD